MDIYWRRLGPVAANYQWSLRLRDQGGNIVAQRDAPPFRGHFPTSAWPSGILLTERVALPPMDALPPGEYDLVVGLLDPKTQQLLPVAGASAKGDDLVLLERLTLGR